MDKNINKQIKSKDRVSDKGEVFTNYKEVKAMLDMIKKESQRINSRVLEPSCGTGNFLEVVLRRKLLSVNKASIDKNRKNILKYEKLSTLAIACLYGIDIMMDNVIECRQRLYNIWLENFTTDCKQTPDEDLCEAIKFILSKNILCGNTLSMKQVNENAQDVDLPIIISNWKFSKKNPLNIQRKDYRYDKLVGDILQNNELSEEYIKNEPNYLGVYNSHFKEVQKYA